MAWRELCASKELTGYALRISAAPSGFGDKRLTVVFTKVVDKRPVNVVDQIRATVTPTIIIILMDVEYQLIDRSIEIFHVAEFRRTVLVEVFRTRVFRTWTAS